MKARMLVLISLLGGLCSLQATPATAPTGVDVIWAYAGVWKIETDHFDTAHSKAGHESSTLRNACWKDGGYLACNQYVDGESKVLIVFTFNAKDNAYTSYQIPPGGASPGSGKLIIDGNVWTFPWQVNEDDQATYFRVVNVFTAPDRIEYKQEFSLDRKHWTTMAKGIETRVGSPQ